MRESLGYSHAEIAEKLGLERAELARLLRGLRAELRLIALLNRWGES